MEKFNELKSKILRILQRTSRTFMTSIGRPRGFKATTNITMEAALVLCAASEVCGKIKSNFKNALEKKKSSDKMYDIGGIIRLSIHIQISKL